MKKLAIVLILIVVVIQGYGQSSTVTRKLLLSLQTGETILTAESNIALILVNNQVNITTMVDDKFYVYKNGQRSGPFDSSKDLDLNKSLAGNDNTDNQCAVYQTPTSEFDPELMEMTENGTFLIKLNGKKYGPFDMLKTFYIWPDKSGFVAIAMDKTMKSSLVTSEGLKVALEGDVEKIQVSPTGKKFVFAVKERDPASQVDFTKMTQQQIIDYSLKQSQATPKELFSYVYVNGTTKLGPFPLNAFYSDNPGFVKTGNANWIMSIDNTLYINGVKIKQFTDIDVNICKTYVSSDGKRYAIVSYDKIYFSDGKTFPSPLETSATEKEGKITLKWISLENEKDLVFYSRDL